MTRVFFPGSYCYRFFDHNGTKDSSPQRLTDFFLEAIVHRKQFGKLRTVV
jgi:hypothetical protein